MRGRGQLEKMECLYAQDAAYSREFDSHDGEARHRAKAWKGILKALGPPEESTPPENP